MIPLWTCIVQTPDLIIVEIYNTLVELFIPESNQNRYAKF